MGTETQEVLVSRNLTSLITITSIFRRSPPTSLSHHSPVYLTFVHGHILLRHTRLCRQHSICPSSRTLVRLDRWHRLVHLSQFTHSTSPIHTDSVDSLCPLSHYRTNHDHRTAFHDSIQLRISSPVRKGALLRRGHRLTFYSHKYHIY